MALLFQPLILCVKGSFLVNIKWSDAEAFKSEVPTISVVMPRKGHKFWHYDKEISKSAFYCRSKKTQGTKCFHSLLRYLIKSASKCHVTASLVLALQVLVRNTGADSYAAMKRMAYNNSRWKAADQSKD
jgi:hypothetical protein